MQPTCNTRATHVQHNVQHEHFCCKFLGFSRDGVKFAPFPFEVALGRRKWPESHFDCKFTGKVVVLHVVLHVCCTSVAWKFPINCVDHVKTCQDTSLKPRKRKTYTRPHTCSVPKDIPHAVAIGSGEVLCKRNRDG